VVSSGFKEAYTVQDLTQPLPAFTIAAFTVGISLFQHRTVKYGRKTPKIIGMSEDSGGLRGDKDKLGYIPLVIEGSLRKAA
jgi:hypothetical protein